MLKTFEERNLEHARLNICGGTKTSQNTVSKKNRFFSGSHIPTAEAEKKSESWHLDGEKNDLLTFLSWRMSRSVSLKKVSIAKWLGERKQLEINE